MANPNASPEEFVADFLKPENRRALFKQFGQFYSSLTLSERKIHSRVHHNTFTPDDGFARLSDLFGSKELANQISQVFIAAGFVSSLRDDTGATVYGITRKGECVAADELDGQLLWIDWIPGSGDHPGVKDLAKVFARFVGGYPNEWSAAKDKVGDARTSNAVVCALDPEYASSGGAGSDTTSGASSGGNITEDGSGGASSSAIAAANRLPPGAVSNFVIPPGIMVKERTLLLKTFTQTFTGAECVRHLLKHTSCVTQRECTEIAAQFVAKGWIACADDPEKSSTAAFKDSPKVVYQVTPAGALFAGWPESPVTKELTFFSKEGLKGRLRKIAGLASSGANVLSGSPSRADTASALDDMISKENLDKFDEFVKKSSDMLHDDRHTDDDSAARLRIRRGTASTISATPTQPLSSEGVEFTSLSGSSVLTSSSSLSGTSAGASGDKGRRPRSATIGAETPSSTNRSRAPSGTPAPQPIAARPGSAASGNLSTTQQNVWETGKETNASRLTTILMIPALRAAFQKYLATMFCQENYDFMVEVERFRLCYDSPLRAAQSTEMLDPTSKPIVSTIQKRRSIASPSDARRASLFPHAVALYLKYVAKGSPFELNLPSKLQTHLRSTMAPAQPFFDQFSSALDLSTTEPLDPTSAPFTALMRDLPDAFWALRADAAADDSVGPWMFATAEAHIFQMVAGDSVPKFVKTEGYKTLMRKLWEEGTLAKVQSTVMAATGGGAGPGAGAATGQQQQQQQTKAYITDTATGEASGAAYVPRAEKPVAVVEPASRSSGSSRPRPNSYIPGI
ncbi:hypothetical protein HDU87_002094 [Geranomyces variabilis]|uniref:Uncharacterized protein n=1 Tax=Geranomyces variabilis TaxID=109894 RepID=A0AAD5XRG9_9FUNG|nr:hypothetical protein HDU87_002094 [Geranomyces variabilis]